MIAAAWQPWVPLPLDPTEVLAFVTGAWSVWLAAKNNVWNWPIGILNSAFFVVLFWGARLYFDMGINVFYVASGFYGWWIWVFGGQNRSRRPVTHLGTRGLLMLLLAGMALTGMMWERGAAISDAAPFPDALTTALSIVAQWLLMKRQVENWYFWIAADLVYIPLYLAKGLPLTAVLYGLFLMMCLRGVRDWRRELRERERGAEVPATPGAPLEASA
jgi:nicotinamide mononucleotide transporter